MGGRIVLPASECVPHRPGGIKSFEAQFGGLVAGKVTPIDFATALVPRFNSGKAASGGNARFIPDLVTAIGMTQKRMGCQ
jgi:hypothetical protein